MTGLATTPVGEELLDDPAADPAIVRSSLGHIARANRWFGGRAALRFALERALRDAPRGRPLSLLDVGTGAGDLPAEARRWGLHHGFRIDPWGLDLSCSAARMAAESGIAAIVGCAGSLPIRDRSVDVVLASQVIHHLRRDAAIRMLGECNRIARIAVIVTDLERARMALAGFWLASRLLHFDAPTRRDGLTSVRRGYTPGEFRQLFADAGLPVKSYRRPAFPFRLVAIGKPA